MRVFVTGASGLVGTELAELLSASGHEVISGYRTHLPIAGKPVHIDLADLEQIKPLIKKAKPDTIIHTAAMTNVDLCEEKPADAMLLNGDATGKIALAANALNALTIYVSTDYVFDGKIGGYGEDSEPNPINQYGRTKLLGELLLKESGAPCLIVRSSVIFGWGRNHRPNFATWVLDNVKSNQPLKVVDDQFATPTLNSNLAEMIIELASKRLEGVLHLAGASRIDRYNFAKLIAETFDGDPNLIRSVKSDESLWKAKRPTDSSLNVEKATKLLDRKPLRLDQALEQFRAGRKE
jgi:dTDP-4-dehydrorhamnose reductase